MADRGSLKVKEKRFFKYQLANKKLLLKVKCPIFAGVLGNDEETPLELQTQRRSGREERPSQGRRGRFVRG